MSDGAIGVMAVTLILSLVAINPLLVTWRAAILERRKLVLALLVQAQKHVDQSKWHREIQYHEANGHIVRADHYVINRASDCDFDITEKGASWIRHAK